MVLHPSPSQLAGLLPSGVSPGLRSYLTSCHTKKREMLVRILHLPDRPDLFHAHRHPILQMKQLRPREGKSLSTLAGIEAHLTPNQRVFGYRCPTGQVRWLLKGTGERKGKLVPALLPAGGGGSSNPRLMTIALGHPFLGASNLLSPCQAVARGTPLHPRKGLLSSVYR